MLPNIELLADDYIPTISVKRKHLTKLYYSCPGVDCKRVYNENDDREIDETSIYRCAEYDHDDILAYKCHSHFTPKKPFPVSNLHCYECNKTCSYSIIFCRKCWKKKTAQDAYHVIDRCLIRMKDEEKEKKKFMNKMVRIPKSIICYVHLSHDAYTTDQWGDLTADEDMDHYTKRTFKLVDPIPRIVSIGRHH